MHLRDFVFFRGKLSYITSRALAGGMLGGFLVLNIFVVMPWLMSKFDPTYSAPGAPDGPMTVFGIFIGITLVVGGFPLNLLVGAPLWLLPVNLAGWGALFGVVAACPLRDARSRKAGLP